MEIVHMQRTMGLDMLSKAINYVGKCTLYSQIDDRRCMTISILFIQLFS